MPKTTTPKTRADRLREQIAYFEKQLKILESRPEDNFEIDATLLFTKRFPRTPDQVYTYTAIKTPRGWYLTGLSQFAMAWEALWDRFLHDAEEIWEASEFTRLNPDMTRVSE